MYQRKQLINYINQNSKPKSVIRISLCRTAKRNPNDRFGLIVYFILIYYNNDKYHLAIKALALSYGMDSSKCL